MKKLNNMTLIIILTGLVLVFVLARIFRSPRLESNLKKVLVELDTTKVTSIKLFPRTEKGTEITFTKEGKQWKVKKAEKVAPVEQGSVNTMLSNLVKLVPQRMVSRKKEKWAEYQVGDSTTRVMVFSEDDLLAELFIGRTGFNQAPNGDPQNPFGGGFGGAFTYVRVGDENEIYSVDGFFESSFNRDFNDWRDKTLLRLKKDMITKIKFNYPDTGFIAERKNGKWFIDNEPADSVKMNNYLGQLEYKNASAFADEFVPASTPDLVLSIEGASAPLGTVQAWKRTNDFVLNSTAQSSVYFSSQSTGIMTSLFEKKGALKPANK